MLRLERPYRKGGQIVNIRNDFKRNMKRRNRLNLLVAISVLLGGGVAIGQPQQPSGIALDDPELYFGFFSLHQAIQKDTARTTDGEGGIALKRAAARHFNISEADFTLIGKIASSVLENISTLMQAADDYYLAERAAGRMPDRTKLEAFQQQRLTVLQKGAKDLQATISPAGWSALHAYINDTYRSHITRKELANGK
jgi:hypothetical protein